MPAVLTNKAKSEFIFQRRINLYQTTSRKSFVQFHGSMVESKIIVYHD